MKSYVEPVVNLLYVGKGDILTISNNEADVWGDDIFNPLPDLPMKH